MSINKLKNAWISNDTTNNDYSLMNEGKTKLKGNVDVDGSLNVNGSSYDTYKFSNNEIQYLTWDDSNKIIYKCNVEHRLPDATTSESNIGRWFKYVFTDASPPMFSIAPKDGQSIICGDSIYPFSIKINKSDNDSIEIICISNSEIGPHWVVTGLKKISKYVVKTYNEFYNYIELASTDIIIYGISGTYPSNVQMALFNVVESNQIGKKIIVFFVNQTTSQSITIITPEPFIDGNNVSYQQTILYNGSIITSIVLTNNDVFEFTAINYTQNGVCWSLTKIRNYEKSNNNWLGTNQFNQSLPTSTIMATDSNELVTKNYCDVNLMDLASEQYIDGFKTFNTTPQCSNTPLYPDDLVNRSFCVSNFVLVGTSSLLNYYTKTYVDGTYQSIAGMNLYAKLSSNNNFTGNNTFQNASLVKIDTNNNIYVGPNAGSSLALGGIINAFFGVNSGLHCRGSYNVALGYGTLSSSQGTSLGNGYLQGNCCFGYNAGAYFSGTSVKPVYNNTCVGLWSGQYHQSGDNNTFIGYAAGSDGLGSWNDSIAIGTFAKITGSNRIILGRSTEVTYAMGGLNIPVSTVLTLLGNISANSLTITPTQLSFLNQVVSNQIPSSAINGYGTGFLTSTITSNLTANSLTITPLQLSFLNKVITIGVNSGLIPQSAIGNISDFVKYNVNTTITGIYSFQTNPLFNDASIPIAKLSGLDTINDSILNFETFMNQYNQYISFISNITGDVMNLNNCNLKLSEGYNIDIDGGSIIANNLSISDVKLSFLNQVDASNKIPTSAITDYGVGFLTTSDMSSYASINGLSKLGGSININGGSYSLTFGDNRYLIMDSSPIITSIGLPSPTSSTNLGCVFSIVNKVGTPPNRSVSAPSGQFIWDYNTQTNASSIVIKDIGVIEFVCVGISPTNTTTWAVLNRDDNVLKSGNQTIAGIKTFSSPPVMSGASISAGTIPYSAMNNSEYIPNSVATLASTATTLASPLNNFYTFTSGASATTITLPTITTGLIGCPLTFRRVGNATSVLNIKTTQTGTTIIQRASIAETAVNTNYTFLATTQFIGTVMAISLTKWSVVS